MEAALEPLITVYTVTVYDFITMRLICAKSNFLGQFKLNKVSHQVKHEANSRRLTVRVC